jgi:aminopeptidase YwaD
MRNTTDLERRVRRDLQELTETIGPRPTGSAGNREAARYLKERFAESDLQVETQEFEALDWTPGSCRLSVGGNAIAAQINPYSPPCAARAQGQLFRSLEELEAAHGLQDVIAVLDGEFVAEQIMPMNFPFYNPEEHLRLNRVLEEKRPQAVIAVGQEGHRGEPLFADGDLQIPTVTITRAEGEKLRRSMHRGVNRSTRAGRHDALGLEIDSTTEKSRGENVLARLNPGAASKVTVVAHFDTWFDTPGAMDNAVGAAVLTGLAQLLSGPARAAGQGPYRGQVPGLGPEQGPEHGAAAGISPNLEVELFANNGEDYYSSAGMLAYLERGMDAARTVLAINIDGIGFSGRDTGLSLYECPPRITEIIGAARRPYPRIAEMEPWPEGDHSVFIMQGIPATALTTLGIHDLMHVYHHTPADRLENIDTARVAEAAEFIAAILQRL